MKKYIIIALNQFYASITYKTNFFVGIVSILISTILSIFTWNAIYASTDETIIAGFSLSEMFWYLLLTNGSSIIFSSAESLRTGMLVKTGRLSTKLIRPVSILYEGFWIFIGKKLFFILLLFFLPFFLYNNGYSFSYSILLWFYSLLILPMFYLLMTTIGNLGFFLIHIWPLRPLINSIYMLFGGFLFPLNIFPNSVFSYIKYNPFAMTSYQYALFIQEKLDFGEALLNIKIVMAWIFILIIIYHWSFSKGLKKYEGMGA
ncbi:ABC-2 family transporter protein [Ignavigranum ruoffiae]|uniref:ABC-2 type transport system permease protein n=1 Tax=Ignavigranum ruoffiae TaxID=89093 RepID=A0A1H8ZX55_9LACT|nr:ABC-2 family transporter protein [Ignavigranum ruoffiae]UPQ85677.1 ABC-2 family transporter protein [Ignavigranum ruoffiae]SEP68861.1 ABC-2 type transport system permease protein [Ignavigranum ruoffiae]